MPVNIQHYRFWREQAHSFDGLAAVSSGGAVTLGGGDPKSTGMASVSANVFHVLGMQPQLGRAFLPDEEQPGRNLVIVISDSLWRRRFGASTAIVGQKVLLNDVPNTMVGVLPAGFRFPKNNDLGPLAVLSPRTEIFRPMGSVPEDWGGDYGFHRVRPLAKRDAAGAIHLRARYAREAHRCGAQAG